ncbi:MAG: methyltransferase domain-containing protein [Bacteroidota bacterium]
MKKRVAYDDYYQSPDLFGAPYPELVAFYEAFPLRGTLLDVGCGQGRDALALAGMGFEVLGIDHSSVGIEQMLAAAKAAQLKLEGAVLDIFQYQAFDKFDFILLDSMFHFAKKDRVKETEFLIRIMRKMKLGAIISVCIGNTGHKVQTLLSIVEGEPNFQLLQNEDFDYQFVDQANSHRSITPYKMLSLKKVGV